MPFPPSWRKYLVTNSPQLNWTRINKRMKEDSNDKRKIANEIILDLFKAKETNQIRLLQQACLLSLRQLDRNTQIITLKDEVDALLEGRK